MSGRNYAYDSLMAQKQAQEMARAFERARAQGQAGAAPRRKRFPVFTFLIVTAITSIFLTGFLITVLTGAWPTIPR